MGSGIYSVAQHMVIMSYLAPPKDALAALLHDLSEGLGFYDLQSPIKRQLPEYCRAEDCITNAILSSHGCLWMPPTVKVWDRGMIWAERRDFHTPSRDVTWAPMFKDPEPPTLPLRIRPLSS